MAGRWRYMRHSESEEAATSASMLGTPMTAEGSPETEESGRVSFSKRDSMLYLLIVLI